MSKETNNSFLKKANIFQPILVIFISIVGGTPIENGHTGKIIILIILGLAFIVWHVECQLMLNKKGDEEEQSCIRKRQTAALYEKACTALSKEYENFANKLDGSREMPWDFGQGSGFLCSTIAAALAEYKKSLIFEVLYIKAEKTGDQTLLSVAGYAQGDHNDGTPSILAQLPRPVTNTPSMLDEQLFLEHRLNPLVLSTPRQVARFFFRKRNQPPEKKYLQYIAVPVVCHRNEIVGPIEVAVKKTPLLSPPVVLEDHELAVVKSWLYHLKNHFLLFHKIEKSLAGKASRPDFPEDRDSCA